MDKFMVETSNEDTLLDLIFKGRNLIVKDRLRVSYLSLKPKNERGYNNDEITASFRVPSSEVTSIKVKITRVVPHSKKVFSPETLQSLLENFGSEEYLSFSIKEPTSQSEIGEIRIDCYEKNQTNKVKLPEQIKRKDLVHLIEMLEIFKIPYVTKRNKITIAPHQWNRTSTYENQAKAYQYASEHHLSPHLYSHLNEKQSVWILEDSDSLLKKRAYRTYIVLEKESSPYKEDERINPEEIAHIESWVQENFDIQIRNCGWKLAFHIIEPKSASKKKGHTSNTTQITEDED